MLSLRRFAGFSFMLMLLVASCEPRDASPAGGEALIPEPAAPAMPRKVNMRTLKQRAAALKQFAERHQYNTQYALLIDFSVFSGAKRLVLYDFRQDKIVSTGMAAHGRGSDYFTEDVAFSNVSGSLCSSPGRYKIGAKYYGQFGWAYKLHGLGTTNSNAFSRFVVLHAHSCVPEEENTVGICRSEGCPMLSPAYFGELQVLLDRQKKPMLLEVYK